MRQLIEIAKAIRGTSAILVMDEPTASLTEEETQNLFRIMRNLKTKGVSIVFISHRLKEVLEIADEITVLRNGEIVKNGVNEEYDMETLIELIVGQGKGRQMIYRQNHSLVPDEYILKVDNLTWDGNPNKISFTLRTGEVLGIVGLLGSGRTEIVETLFGLRHNKDVKIYIEGKQVKISNVRDAVKEGIALIPENRRDQGISLMHDILNNIMIPNLSTLQRMGFLDIRKSKTITKDCISEFSIKTKSIEDKASSLSGGNQQKVVIAKWFKTNPKILLMDEPTAGVDIGAKTEIIEIIRNFVEHQRSVIFISSEFSEVMAICDRIIVLKNGKILQELYRDDIQVEEELQHAVQA
jgi:ribose transport system ATP-binding protein